MDALHDFGRVKRLAPRGLDDLLATTEPVGYDEVAGGADRTGREQDAFAGFDRYVVAFAPLEAERARHPAAPGVDDLHVEAQMSEQALLVVESEDGLVVAVGLRWPVPLGRGG